MATASNEMQLLLCCACRDMNTERIDRLRALLRSRIDWDRLLILAARHKLLPLLTRHLKTQRAAVPHSTLQQLQRAFLENSGQMLSLSAELLQTTRLFAEQKIAVVPYKGPALGAYLYGNLALRQAGDLDLLVKRADVCRARVILVARGYVPRHVLSPGAEGFMLRSRYSEEFERPPGPSVELHWAFTNGDVAVPLDLEALEQRLQTMSVGGGTISMFGREDLLQILCIHGGKHRWDRLEWLCGVAELLRANAGDLDWDAVLDQAAVLGTRRMLLLGILLANELLGAPLPDECLRVARSDRAVLRLALEVPKLFEAEPAVGDGTVQFATDLFRLQLRERPRDRLRFIWYRLTTPSRPENWRAVSIGARSFATHGVVRPFRLLAKLFGVIWERRLGSRARAAGR